MPGWMDALNDWARQADSPYSSAGGSGFGSLASTEEPWWKRVDWSGGFKDFTHEAASGLGAALVGAGVQGLFPGTNAKVFGTDTRTATGASAEDTRLATARTA